MIYSRYWLVVVAAMAIASSTSEHGVFLHSVVERFLCRIATAKRVFTAQLFS